MWWSAGKHLKKLRVCQFVSVNSCRWMVWCRLMFDSLSTTTMLRLVQPHPCGLKLYEIDAFNSQAETSFLWARERVSDRASEQMGAVERMSDFSRKKQVNEWADDRMARYSTRRFHKLFTQCAHVTCSANVVILSACLHTMRHLACNACVWFARDMCYDIFRRTRFILVCHSYVDILRCVYSRTHPT